MTAFPLFHRLPFSRCAGSRIHLLPLTSKHGRISRRWFTPPEVPLENTNVSHARFLAEAPTKMKWKQDISAPGSGETDAEDTDSITDEKGKLSPTSSHLFKLILPLDSVHCAPQTPRPRGNGGSTPTVFLLHPSQPLSHISRLIAASLAPARPAISFRNISPKGKHFQWSDSTDIGDFIKNAARASEFEIHFRGDHCDEKICVEVPTFEDRTRFLRRRLSMIEDDLKDMEALKQQCDREAHRGARRMAVSGFGMLIVYWGAVARLTFWDFGWDVMEPITYLSGLSTVVLGYLWFLYQGREVSYTSVLDRSISSRREALYQARGLDVERWLDLVTEAKCLRREIGTIAEDYDERKWKEQEKKRESGEAQVADSETAIKQAQQNC